MKREKVVEIINSFCKKHKGETCSVCILLTGGHTLFLDSDGTFVNDSSFFCLCYEKDGRYACFNYKDVIGITY